MVKGSSLTTEAPAAAGGEQPTIATGEELDKIQSATLQWARERPGMDLAFFQMVTVITLVAQQIEMEFRTYAQTELDMGPGDLRIILALRRSGPDNAQSPVNLEKNLFVTSGAITKQLARLTQRNLVRRYRRKDGRRGWLIELTDEGRVVAEKAAQVDNSLAFPIFERAFHSFNPDEQLEGLRFLRRLNGKLEAARRRHK